MRVRRHFGNSVVLLSLAALSATTVAAQSRDFTVGGITAPAGTRASGFLTVPAGSDAGTTIPVTIINGAKPGPVLALVAGTHGYEYAPIIALERVAARVNPQELTGTLIIVHVANMPSFLGRTVYKSPVDGKNLNRVYPGRADGTVSERIADVITREVIARADYLADMHCGDGNEHLSAYSYWSPSGTDEVNEKSRQMALAFGLDHIVIDTQQPHDPAKSVYTENTAILRGKPAITAETGGMGRVDDDGPVLAEAGAMNLLRFYKMLPGEPQRAEHPIWIDKYEVLTSKVAGVFHAQVQPGHTVAEGTVLGVLTDFFGKPVQEIRAPFAGIVMYVVATPPINAGDPLGMIGHIKAE